MSEWSRSNDFRESGAEWCYLGKAGEVGPVATAAFLRAVQSGAVLPETRVRLAGSNDWFAAGEIDGLEFPLVASTESVPDRAESPRAEPNLEMRRLFAECVDRQRAGTSRHPREQPRELTGPTKLQSLAARVASGLKAVAALNALIFAPLGRFLQLRVVWVSIAVLLAELVAFQIVSKLPASFTSQERDYLSLMETFGEWKELQSRNASDGEWDEFCARSEEKLETVLPNLERNARSSDPVSMALLRIARDDMPRLLYERPSPDSRVALDTTAHFWAPQAKFRQASQPTEQWDVAMVTIIGVDLLIVFATVGYIGWKRHRKRASERI